MCNIFKFSNFQIFKFSNLFTIGIFLTLPCVQLFSQNATSTASSPIQSASPNYTITGGKSGNYSNPAKLIIGGSKEAISGDLTLTTEKGMASGGKIILNGGGGIELKVSGVNFIKLGNISVSSAGSMTGITSIGIGASVKAGTVLTAKGKILAEEFEIVSNVNQPDYVFDASYNLKPLSEVEQFIQSNKHLPDVPSAAHAKENGYKIVEMDNALLRKVEELTLYVIELNKQLEATKAELAEVKGGN